MKTIHFLLSSVTALFFGMCISSCGSDDEDIVPNQGEQAESVKTLEVTPSETETDIYIGDGMKFSITPDNKGTAEVKGCESTSDKIEIPYYIKISGETFVVTSIGQRAFKGLVNLVEVKIPESVTSIGSEAFGMCYNLQTVNLPNSVTEIRGKPFNDCFSLSEPLYNERIFVRLPTSYSGEYSVPDGITTIHQGAFYCCEELTGIILPESVTEIVGQNFLYCPKINSPVYNKTVFAMLPYSYSGAYYVPAGIKKVSAFAFQNCSKLTSVDFPESVTEIGNGAFQGCNDLYSITLGKNVSKLGDFLFLTTTPSRLKLSYIVSNNPTPPVLENDSFYCVDKNKCVINVPTKQACLDYSRAKGWSEFKTII